MVNKIKKEIRKQAFQEVINLCNSEAVLYEENGRRCDETGNTIGGYGDCQSAATVKYIREKVIEIMRKD